jgi:2-dehydro-3-deoxy-D-arabinonate dehydratase
MRYYQLSSEENSLALVVDDGDELYDLTSAHTDLTSFTELARTASISEEPIDAIARRHIDDAETISEQELDQHLCRPIRAAEVWAAGVTYGISEKAREAESSMSEIYLKVYDAERPEIFFKATPSRTVGPNDDVGIRGDSSWDVPEPEVGIVMFRGEIIGYTIGNDMSSRQIEGENPLYLPQAKVFDRCCSIGPCIVTPDGIEDPRDLTMSMEIVRGEKTVFSESTSTKEMVRSYEELTSYFTTHNSVPETAVLLTGTSLVPQDDFTLHEDDRITISVEGIGTLENTVVTV